MEELEMLDLGDVELEEVKRAKDNAKLPFPAVTVGKEYLYFNKNFLALFGDKTTKVKFYTTPQYVIIAEAGPTDINTFSFKKRARSFVSVRYPSDLQEKKIKLGTYKILRCKQGFAFNRYEPLEDTK